MSFTGARTTAPALGAVQDVIQSKVPALGYTVLYAVGNTLLTICGIAIVMLISWRRPADPARREAVFASRRPEAARRSARRGRPPRWRPRGRR